ncbi:MAG: radical SAM protein, partial [Candidatus Omnitrophica bacterium]|nr:radical SAM protein [Candidatus Omnitrophota bacterium]
MNNAIYRDLLKVSLSKRGLSSKSCLKILESRSIDLLDLLSVSYKIRQKYFGKTFFIHIINNVQNGLCSEDCSYCAQAKGSRAKIFQYPIKTDVEILREAEEAYKKGAFRYCLVFSGKNPSISRIKHLSKLIRKIKSKFNIEVCVSPGIIDEEMARILKDSGLNRLNHNINTAHRLYPEICSTHTFTERVNT